MTNRLEQGLQRATFRRRIAAVTFSIAVHGPIPAAPQSAPALEEILARTGATVEVFWERGSAVTAVETLTQLKMGENGKVEDEYESIYDYLLLTDQKEDGCTAEESRLPKKNERRSKGSPLLVTSGFPTLLLVFHPQYQLDYRYRLDGEEEINGAKLIRVHFEHVPAAPSTMAIQLGGRIHPLDLTGAAWIEAETGVIWRMAVELMAPMEDLNLRALNADVVYEPRRFPSVPGRYWLPSTATIDLKTARQHWRNIHRYSNYRRFSVTSEEVVRDEGAHSRNPDP